MSTEEITSYPGGRRAQKLNALKEVRKFCGQGDIEEWIEMLEGAIRIDEIAKEKEADIMAMRLEGPARAAWRTLPLSAQRDAEAVKTELRRMFGLQKFQAWEQLSNRTTIYQPKSFDVERMEAIKLASIALPGAKLETLETVAVYSCVQR